MTDRREFVGAMLALFTGVAMPAVVRELIVIPSQVDLTATDLDRMMREIFTKPIYEIMVSDSELLKLFPPGDPLYVQTVHMFDVPFVH